MFSKKALATLISSSLFLVGCGSDSDSTPTETSPQTMTITAISGTQGYFANANLYPVMGESCATWGEALGKTNEQGQAQVNVADLDDGYCAVNEDESITLFAAKPAYFEHTTASFISPITTYIHQAILEGNAQNIEQLVSIRDAKTQLAQALGLEIDEQGALFAMLSGDYIQAQNAATRSQTDASMITAMAELLIQTHTDSALTSTQVVNIAKVSAPQLTLLAQDLTSEDSKETLSNLSNFISINLDVLADANEDDLAALQDDANDSDKLANLPKALTVSGTALDQQLEQAIEALLAQTTETPETITLSHLQLTGVVDQNPQDGNSQYQLTMRKEGSRWGDAIVADSTTESLMLADNTLSLSELHFNQAGLYVLELTVLREIEGEMYHSLPVVIEVIISNKQVLNTAPSFHGLESQASKDLIAELEENAADPFSFTEELIIPGVIELPASFTLNPGNIQTLLTPLFTDKNSNDEETTLSYHLETTDQGAMLEDWGLGHMFSSDTLDIPATGSISHQYSIYAMDEFGARSETTFDFTLIVNANKTAEILTGLIEEDEENNETPDVPQSFLATMVKPSMLTTLENTFLAKLGVEFEEAQNVNTDQIFQVFTYTCDAEGQCQRGVSGDYLPMASLEANSYFTLDDAGHFAATGTAVTEPETMHLTATYNGEPIKIYAVDDNNKLLENDLSAFGTGFDISISAGAAQPEVSVTIK